MKPNKSLRFLTLALAAGGVFALAKAGLTPEQQAEQLTASYPTRPVTIVVTFPPGGGTDWLARRLSLDLSQDLGQPVVVENRAGASGNIGAQSVAKSEPEGHTLLMVNSSYAVNPGVFKELGFDPLHDLKAVVNLGYVPSVLAVPADAPYQSLAELLQAAQQGVPINIASCGNGTPQHLAAEQVKQRAQVFMQHIPYKGCGPALAAVAGKQVHAAVITASSAAPFIQQGALRGLGVTSPARSKALPDVPTIAEQGYPGFELNQWHGLLAPAATPQPLIEALNARINQLAATPAFQADLLKAGFDPKTDTATAFHQEVLRDIARFKTITSEIGLKID